MSIQASRQARSEDRVEARPSLGFEALIDRLERIEEPSILDLGTASGRNVRFLSRFARRLTIADLRGSLRETPGVLVRDAPASEAGGGLRSTLHRWLEPMIRGRHYDAVLAWDLFDYLSSDDLAKIMGIVRPTIRPGAIVFAMVSYVARIPRQPSSYQIRGRDSLLCDASSPGDRPSPRHKEPDLLKVLDGFSVDTTFLMRHGVQEYLFVRDPPPVRPGLEVLGS